MFNDFKTILECLDLILLIKLIKKGSKNNVKRLELYGGTFIVEYNK